MIINFISKWKYKRKQVGTLSYEFQKSPPLPPWFFFQMNLKWLADTSAGTREGSSYSVTTFTGATKVKLNCRKQYISSKQCPGDLFLWHKMLFCHLPSISSLLFVRFAIKHATASQKYINLMPIHWKIQMYIKVFLVVRGVLCCTGL